MRTLGAGLVLLVAGALLAAELTVFHWIDRLGGSSVTSRGPARVSPDGRWQARLVVTDPGPGGHDSSGVEARPLRGGSWAGWREVDEFEEMGHLSWQSGSTLVFTSVDSPDQRHTMNVPKGYYPSVGVVERLAGVLLGGVGVVLVTAVLFWPVSLLLVVGLLAVWLVPRAHDRIGVRSLVEETVQCLRERDWHGAAGCFWAADGPTAGESAGSRLQASPLAGACVAATGGAPRLRRLRCDRKLPGLGYAADVSFPNGASGEATTCTVPVIAVGREWRLLLK